MATEVLMPVVTEGGEDAVVTAWLVDEGWAVTAGQLLAEVQAEKVAQEVTAPHDGVVGRLLVAINEPVPQGTPICLLEETAAAGVEPAAAAASETAPAAADEEPVRVAASPAARRVAGELGVELAGIAGSGPGGRITEEDVRAAAAGAAPGATELVGLRGVIARNVRASQAETAAVTLTTTADVTGTLPDHITAWVVRAAAAALASHPQLCGHREGDRFVPAAVPNVALAVQTDGGLMAPVVRDPASKSLDEVATEIAELAKRARSQHLEAADFEGGTFTVTNLGSYGVDAFTPIINPGQVAILGVGAVRTEPGFAADGTVEARRRLTLSLTFDHSFVDGAPAAAYLADVRNILEGGD